jgi:hypothetical protein
MSGFNVPQAWVWGGVCWVMAVPSWNIAGNVIQDNVTSRRASRAKTRSPAKPAGGA